MSDNVYAHTPTQCIQEWQPFSQLSSFTMQTRRVDSTHVWRTGTNCYTERLHEILATEIKNVLVFPVLVLCPLCFQSTRLAKVKLFFYLCSLYRSVSFALCLFDAFLLTSQTPHTVVVVVHYVFIANRTAPPCGQPATLDWIPQSSMAGNWNWNLYILQPKLNVYLQIVFFFQLFFCVYLHSHDRNNWDDKCSLIHCKNKIC